MWLILGLALHLLVAVIVSGHVVLQRKRPVVQCAWVFAVIGLPLIGIFFYLMLGTDRMRQRWLRQRRRFDALRDGGFAVPAESLAEAKDLGPDLALIAGLGTLTAMPPTCGNLVSTLLTPGDFYESLEHAIGSSSIRCWLCFYTWRDDRVGRHFVEALATAARRGVDVRLICDEVGCGTTPASTFDPLVDAGGHFTWANTIAPRRNRWNPSLRNHRKIVIIDNDRAYMGGLNIGSEYVEGANDCEWLDLHFVLQGPVLRQVAAVFADDWHFATDEKLPALTPAVVSGRAAIQIIPGGPDRSRSVTSASLRLLAQAARENLILSTPYLAPDEAFISELALAVCRGVRVQLFVSRHSDLGSAPSIGRSFFQRLIQAGVEIHEYQEGIHHTKLFLVDGRLSLIGSINLDIRSFDLNYEIGALVVDPDLATQLEAEIHNRQATRTYQLADLIHRPLVHRLRERVFRLVAPLL